MKVWRQKPNPNRKTTKENPIPPHKKNQTDTITIKWIIALHTGEILKSVPHSTILDYRNNIFFLFRRKNRTIVFLVSGSHNFTRTLPSFFPTLSVRIVLYKSLLSINNKRIYNYVENGWREVAILKKKRMAEKYKGYKYRKRPLTLRATWRVIWKCTLLKTS